MKVGRQEAAGHTFDGIDLGLQVPVDICRCLSVYLLREQKEPQKGKSIRYFDLTTNTCLH